MSESMKELAEMDRRIHSLDHNGKELGEDMRKMAAVLVNYLHASPFERPYTEDDIGLDMGDDYLEISTGLCTGIEVPEPTQVPVLDLMGFSITAVHTTREGSFLKGSEPVRIRKFEVGRLDHISNYPHEPDDYEYVVIDDFNSFYNAVAEVLAQNMKSGVDIFCEQFIYHDPFERDELCD
jgi:hypothetical protein